MPAELTAHITIRIAARASGEGAVALGAGRSQRQLYSHALCSVVSGVRVDVSRPSGACVRASCPTLFLRP